MRTSRFLWKLYAGYCGVIAITSLFVGYPALRYMQEQHRQEIYRELSDKAAQLSALVDTEADFQGSALADRFARQRTLLSPGTRLTLIREDGIVVAESHADPAKMDNHRTRPEVVEAADTGFGTSTRYSSSVGSVLSYVAVPIVRDGKTIGFARAALPLEVVELRAGELQTQIVLGLALAMLMAALLGFPFARFYTRQLASLARVARSMAGGDYRVRLDDSRDDEFGQLARLFGQMGRQLEERLDTITSDRNKLLTVLGGMSEGVIAVDRSEAVMHMNSVAGRLLDGRPEEWLGRRVWEVSRVREVNEILTRTLEIPKRTTAEIRVVRVGRDRVFEIRASPIHDGEGALVGAVAVFEDVTDMRRLEQMRTDFVANVSHELKTPITAIRGLAETMERDEEMPMEMRQRFLGRISDQALRLATLVGGLLTIARLESEEAAFQMTAFDLRNVVRDVALRFQPEVGDRLVIEIPDEPVSVDGDEHLLGIGLQNLVENAFKYNPDTPKVWVRLRVGESAQIEVEDRGVGIDPVHQDRLFERFYRVDKARSRELGGTGLGLAIVKHICRSHGGDVSLESAPGRGSKFTMSIPRSPATVAGS